MFKRLSVVFLLVLFSGAILFGSITRSTIQVRFTQDLFAQSNDEVNEATDAADNGESMQIGYYFVYPGKILPDSPLWTLKAFRDKLFLSLTFNPVKKANRKLLYADKRIVAARMLFEKGKANLAETTLEKAEKYLEEAYVQETDARKKGKDTNELLLTISKASLKHRQEIEENILDLAPSNIKPSVIKTLDYPKDIYSKSRNDLLERGMTPPNNPFEE